MYPFSHFPAPQVSPTRFAIDDASLNATSAIFTWDPVDPSLEIMQGRLRGYQVVEKESVEYS